MRYLKWFTKSWWQYLLEKPVTLKKLWCRIRRHPAGIWYYNASGWEPDYHCKNCGDEL